MVHGVTLKLAKVIPGIRNDTLTHLYYILSSYPYPLTLVKLSQQLCDVGCLIRNGVMCDSSQNEVQHSEASHWEGE